MQCHASNANDLEVVVCEVPGRLQIDEDRFFNVVLVVTDDHLYCSRVVDYSGLYWKFVTVTCWGVVGVTPVQLAHHRFRWKV